MNELSEFMYRFKCHMVAPLATYGNRFPDYDKLRSQWDGLILREKHLQQDYRRMTELVNEISIANIILSDRRTQCILLEYEPPLRTGNCTIDYLATYSTHHLYFDVKTIHPQTMEDWKGYEAFQSYLPSNVGVILEREEMGGEIWHDMYASRSHMLDYTLELESKIELCRPYSNTCFVMTFCSNGFDWSLDELEDFADFYHIGIHNPDDPFSEAEKYDIGNRDIMLNRTINAFCYHERPETDLRHSRFVTRVRGPYR